MKKFTVAEFARHIQHLSTLPTPTGEEKMELRFYLEVLQKTTSTKIGNLVPISSYPIENAQRWAALLDMHVVEGGSGGLYLSWSKGLERD